MQFLLRLFITLLIIVVISGVLQFYFIKDQIAENIDSKSAVLSQSVEQGIAETRLASESIEHQIDLRLEGDSKRIANEFNNNLEDISADDLNKMKNELGITGITLFQKKGNDIVGVKSTDPSEIGFSFKKVGYYAGYKDLDTLLSNKKVESSPTYSTRNLYILPISQSGSHNDKPTFFKYAYYHEPGTNYIINPYIKANEVYQFTKEVGPDSWIKRMKEKNNFIKEIAVLNPKVFKNPKLETKLFPPLKKVIYGEYKYKDSRDKKVLINMLKNGSKKVNFLQKNGNEKIYKMFIPTNNGQVIYIALDYGVLSAPLYRHSIILIVTGIVALVALFLITARFFNKIYQNIQLIKSQIKLLENGDLTAKSDLSDGSELTSLSMTVNSMVDKWNSTVEDTQEHATKTQRLAVLLEAESSHSVEKLFEVSTESTIASREQLYEISEFLDSIEKAFLSQNNEEAKKVIEKVELMRKVANDRTSATTDITITLSDLLKSLHKQSSELSETSNKLLEKMSKFKL
jgi:methyl-accepting chemotaxis protein